MNYFEYVHETLRINAKEEDQKPPTQNKKVEAILSSKDAFIRSYQNRTRYRFRQIREP